MTDQLAAVLRSHLDVEPPPGDLAAVVRRGRGVRRRRRAMATVTVVAVLAAIWVGATAAIPTAGERAADHYARFAPMDASGGLRAYADPDVAVHLGGSTYDATDLGSLDTDAIATPHGIVFYDDNRPMLLRDDGVVEALVDGSVDRDAGFHPTAKADSVSDEVAFAVLDDGEAVVTVRDLDTDEDVHSWSTSCGRCTDLVIDAYDDGVLFVRTSGTTLAVDMLSEEVVDLGAGVRVADVRNGTVLYSGVEPTPAPSGTRDWTFVEGAIDSELTFDGAYVVGWSSLLAPIDPRADPVRLDVGPTDGSLGFWSVDTDGSVLVIAPDGTYPRYTVHDCEVPSGTCTPLGPFKPKGGDPAFIGADM
ncbi:hypothetical protein L2K70_07525 [Nocardioides KLBMP 9356]|uniref:WD40 repeat domain-containing protein n=1 Tax=Nocardioides potassii TaxID=2911371 RepID=A0ABS9HBE9_9ACTN|nr:hypothetical protein [Nocardioides potassii]MCF6377451.1 hypothetical protein [Nocardioides potassii]